VKTNPRKREKNRFAEAVMSALMKKGEKEKKKKWRPLPATPFVGKKRGQE